MFSREKILKKRNKMHLGKKNNVLRKEIGKKPKTGTTGLRNRKASNYTYANPSLVQNLTINCLGTAELDLTKQRLADLDQYDVIRIPAKAENGLAVNQTAYLVFKST